MAENETKPSDEENKTTNTGIENLKVLENIQVKLTVEVGSTELKIGDLLRLNEGSVVELERLAGEFAAVQNVDKSDAATKLEKIIDDSTEEAA